MSTSIYDLEDRTTYFSQAVIRMVKRANRDIVTEALIRQVVRSATSIGANYHEANGSSSRLEFRHKMSICKKEAKETAYWLGLLVETDETVATDCLALQKESRELSLIFARILSRLYRKED